MGGKGWHMSEEGYMEILLTWGQAKANDAGWPKFIGELPLSSKRIVGLTREVPWPRRGQAGVPHRRNA